MSLTHVVEAAAGVTLAHLGAFAFRALLARALGSIWLRYYGAIKGRHLRKAMARDPRVAAVATVRQELGRR